MAEPSGGTPPSDTAVSADELQHIGRMVARSLLSAGAGDGPNPADENLFGQAIADVLGLLTATVASAAGVAPIEVLRAAFGSEAVGRTRQEMLDLCAVRLELLLRGIAS